MSSRNSAPEPLSIPRQRSASLGGAFNWTSPLTPTSPVALAQSPTTFTTNNPFGVPTTPVTNSSPPSSLGRRFSTSFGSVVATPKIFTVQEHPFSNAFNQTSPTDDIPGHKRDLSNSSTSSASSSTIKMPSPSKIMGKDAIFSRLGMRTKSVPDRPASPMGSMILQGQLLD